MHDYVSFNIFDLVVQISKTYIMVVIVNIINFALCYKIEDIKSKQLW